MRVLPLLVCLAPLGFGSCAATGNYFADRGLDFLDQYRFAVGAGTTIGVRVKGSGLYETGLMVGLKPKATALGWRYGAPLTFDTNDTRMDANQAQLVTVSSAVGLDIDDGSYVSAWNSFALLPAVFTWTDSTPEDFEWEVSDDRDTFDDSYWLWNKRTFRDNRYALIHAFDTEVEIALGLYLDTGFSIGEAIDFWLGWLWIDIAKDDGRARR